MTVKPKRAGVPDDLRDLYKRVRILEALNNGLGSAGRTFDTYRDCVLANPNLVSFWPFDDAVGATVAEDIVGSRDYAVTTNSGYPLFGQPGVYAGLPLETSVEGDGAATTGRLTRNADAGDNVLFASGAFTLETWVYPLIPSNLNFIFFTWDGNPGGNIVDIGLDVSNQLFVGVGNGGTIANTAATAIAADTWSHVRVTVSVTTITLYINGVAAGTAARGTFTGTNTWVVLNTFNSGGTYIFSAGVRLAYMALYDTVITDSCDPEGGGGGPCLGQGKVPVTDGDCGWSWEYPLEVTY